MFDPVVNKHKNLILLNFDYLFYLKKPYLDLAKDEILFLLKSVEKEFNFKVKRFKLIDTFLIITIEYYFSFIDSLKNVELNKFKNTKKVYQKFLGFEKRLVDFLSRRLGFCHAIYRLLFKSNYKKIFENTNNFNWAKIYKKSFCVRVHFKEINKNDKKFKKITNHNKKYNPDYSIENLEKNLANLIYEKLRKSLAKKPKVNLEKQHTKIEFFLKDNIFYSCLFLRDVDKSYLNRKAHLRPGFHPTSLSPDLAKVCVNLTGLNNIENRKNNKNIIFDPFCGSGGILIESGLMNFFVIGNDLIKKQLEYAEKNFNFYGIKDFLLLNYDINEFDYCLLLDFFKKINNNFNFKISNKNFAIVSDLPYGKGSFGKNLDKLYFSFLNNFKNFVDALKLKENEKNFTLVLIFPNFINYEYIIRKANYKVKKKYFYYVHKSLTRVIVVLTPY